MASDSVNWHREGPRIREMNALTVPIGEKINYFTPANGTTVLEILPGLVGVVIVEVEAGSFRCRVGKLDIRTFTAEADDDKLTISGHPYIENDGPLMVSNDGGALPAGLVVDTEYWIRDVDGNTFRLALTRKGPAIDLTSDGTGTNSIGGDNGTGNAVGFVPLAPVASAASVLAVGGKKLRTDELQVFDAPVSIVGETGAGDILAWWLQ